MSTRVLFVFACAPALVILAALLTIYRLKILMYVAGVTLLVLGALMHLGLAWPGPLAIRIARWIGREIEANG